MAYCPSCAHELGGTESKCPKCGADFTAKDGWKPVEVPRPRAAEERPAGVTIICWFMLISGSFSALAIISRLSQPEVRLSELPLPAWFFCLVWAPLFFASCILMLKGKNLARQLYVALGVTVFLFTLVVMPITGGQLARVLLFVTTVVVLYRPRAHRFFAAERAADAEALKL